MGMRSTLRLQGQVRDRFLCTTVCKSCIEDVGTIWLLPDDDTCPLVFRLLSDVHMLFSWCPSHVGLICIYFAGGIDLELAPQVVTALDDVCILSPRSFDRPSLAALLGEVCLWLVEQRIGPRAQHARYRSCDPYAQVGGVQIYLLLV